MRRGVEEEGEVGRNRGMELGEKKRIVEEEGGGEEERMRARKGVEGMSRGREKERCRGGEE